MGLVLLAALGVEDVSRTRGKDALTDGGDEGEGGIKIAPGGREVIGTEDTLDMVGEPKRGEGGALTGEGSAMLCPCEGEV
jgi:hypothetical protein